MVEQKRARGGQRASVMIFAGAAAVALGATSITVFRAGWFAEPEPSKTSIVERVSPTQRPKFPQFGKPDEARRYYDAKAKGDERTLAALDRALAEAEVQGADAKYVEGLERERALRRERRQMDSAAQGQK